MNPITLALAVSLTLTIGCTPESPVNRSHRHEEHAEEYCGIVYADSFETPSFVKIYDPGNLGVSCGYSDHPPLPGWILSRLPPSDLNAAAMLPANRKRWWRRLLGV